MHIAQVFGYATGPLPVKPGAHQQKVVRIGRVLLLDGLVDGQGAEGVLGVKPASYGHHCRFYVGEVRPRVARLPEIIVVRVTHQVFPEGDRVAEVVLIDVLDRANLQEELIIIRHRIIEPTGRFPRGFRPRLAEAGVERKSIHQEKRAAVVKVVADKPIRHRCLGRDSPQGRMSLR